VSTADDLERIKRYGHRRFWLNIAAYALTGILVWIAISFIPAEVVGAERRAYYAGILAGAYFFGLFINWLVLFVFKEDISK